MVPEYVSEGMETMRQEEDREAAFSKSLCKAARLDSKRALGSTKHTTAVHLDTDPLPPLVPCTGLPQGM